MMYSAASLPFKVLRHGVHASPLEVCLLTPSFILAATSRGAEGGSGERLYLRNFKGAALELLSGAPGNTSVLACDEGRIVAADEHGSLFIWRSRPMSEQDGDGNTSVRKEAKVEWASLHGNSFDSISQRQSVELSASEDRQLPETVQTYGPPDGNQVQPAPRCQRLRFQPLGGTVAAPVPGAEGQLELRRLIGFNG